MAVGMADVDPDEIVTVLPPDRIPAITSPRFTKASYLADSDPVLGVALGGEARAYPLAILDWHEIVDDVVGDVPVAATYCPLCATGMAFDRRVDGRALTFKVSGRLLRNALVMYDVETETLWSQMLGEALVGPHRGKRLDLLGADVTSWGDWRALHPDTLLLEPPHGVGTDRQRPYRDYETSLEVRFPRRHVDDRLHPKEVVLGLRVGDAAKAYPEGVVAAQGVVPDEVGGRPVVVTSFRGLHRAFATEGQTFRPGPGPTMLDAAGVSWDRLAGRSEGASLERLPLIRAFWFAWADFYPGSALFEGRGPASSP
jgi:hypothetical protein